ncbi:dephospho-CoA kinase [Cellvibrio sp.]|uniref:dephospho-CoA kinase n=1 Tax=Cellvibrio sp. TaxID=1965322 RepID=UPI0039647D24
MIVGLTGGIGSGKSEVSARFERLGIIVVDADMIARQVVEPGGLVLEKIAEHFGKAIITKDGALDRKQLRSIIFEQPSEKIWLESLLHPIIRAETIAQLNSSQSPYTILSSPLLLETNQHELVDRVLVVDADETLQVSRASSRDSISPENIQKIMQSQLSRSARCAKADDIILNHGDLHELQDQVEFLHARYLHLAQQTH